MIEQEVNPPLSTRIITRGLSLITGPWRHWFDDEKYKVIVASALNICVHQHKLDIAGYLITERRVFLVLRIDKDRIPGMLDKFSEYLEAEIRYQKVPVWNAPPTRPIAIKNGSPFNGLFEVFVLRNELLKKLLTGRQIPYPYSPQVARLKKRVSNYNFCSVMDYEGAQGPVKISRLPKEKVITITERP